MKKLPLVSICCITYNHSSFIQQCLDGFLMQKPPSGVDKDEPWYEILIHDDASSDGTESIIREYAAKYPDVIKPLYETEGVYRKLGKPHIDWYNFHRAQGRYIAYCEGDDYWTDPFKLQKQVDFMEANPEYSVCFHATSIYNVIEDKLLVPDVSGLADFDMDADMFLNAKTRVGQPLSMLFRTEVYNYEWEKHYSRYCDSMQIYHILCEGKGRFMQFVGGQYNIQPKGISSSNTDVRRSWEDCEDFLQMWNYTHDPIVLKKCRSSYVWRLEVCSRNKMMRDYWYTVWYSIKNTSPIGGYVLKKAIIRWLKR